MDPWLNLIKNLDLLILRSKIFMRLLVASSCMLDVAQLKFGFKADMLVTDKPSADRKITGEQVNLDPP